MFFHSAFGLSIRTPIRLPELDEGDAGGEVVVRFGNVDLPPGSGDDACAYATSNEAWFQWEDGGRFLVSCGREIVIDPARGVDEEALRRYLLGPVLAMLLHQRGFLVLHGGAVSRNGGAAAFIGDSGQGKSTATAALVSRGHEIVSDDIVAIDVQWPHCPCIVPGFREVNLWMDSASAISGVSSLPLLRSEAGGAKRAYRVEGAGPASPVPLKCIYRLEAARMPVLEAIPKEKALRTLFDHSFGPTLIRFGLGTRLLRQCADLVRDVAVAGLTRSWSLADLEAFTDLIERDISRRNEAQTAA